MKKSNLVDEIVGWYHRHNEHTLEQILGDSEGQGSLACFSPWSHKDSDKTQLLNNDEQQTQTILKTYEWEGQGKLVLD